MKIKQSIPLFMQKVFFFFALFSSLNLHERGFRLKTHSIVDYNCDYSLHTYRPVDGKSVNRYPRAT